ncbi:MAG: methionyl-tRNA formyltransferase, partial [Gemmatimonadota bacterium]|nr:methionyl-tRNA formyltransferase [Gemmatimonadota bacterium]
MRIVFCGTPASAVPSLEALAERGWEISAVVTQPDRPAGRGAALAPPPVKTAAESLGIPVLQPSRLPEIRGRLEEIRPDVVAVVAYGRIFRRWLLELPRLGCVNVHFSLLPRHRGVAPVQWAVIEGDRETGV